MIEREFRRVWLGAAAVLIVCTVASWAWGAHVAGGILAGGAWNLASLWCLMRLLDAWLGSHPSRRRAIGWLLLKFPLLYLLVFVVFRRPAVSLVGFGIGFTVVLAVVVGGIGIQATRTALAPPHDR